MEGSNLPGKNYSTTKFVTRSHELYRCGDRLRYSNLNKFTANAGTIVSGQGINPMYDEQGINPKYNG